MQSIAGFIFLIVFGVNLIIISLYNILVGVGKIHNPMYDTFEKKKYIKNKGIFGLILSAICTCFFGIILLLILLWE